MDNSGIPFEPSGGAATLYVKNSIFRDNVFGIQIAPPTGGFAFVDIDNTRLLANSEFGLFTTTSAGGTEEVGVRISVASFNINAGFGALSSGGRYNTIMIDSSEASHNTGHGIRCARIAIDAGRK